ncbi:hypothetical protein MKW92_014727 [Papaver armeniacum]|nr:hypothetical protein MKW92_014727 [Papaver armeniacum]
MMSMVLMKNKGGDISIILPDEIVVDILIRLPVKTLIRFKSVCRRWLSLIKDDPYFIDLHLTRSKLRPCFTLAIPRSTYGSFPAGATYVHNKPHKAELLIADLSETGRITTRATPIIHNVGKTVSLNYDGILKPINGLICFTSVWVETGVCMYNLGTQELSPWIKMTSPIDHKTIFFNGDYLPTYQFGFDPCTKEHKVICMWNDKFGESGYVATQVMTVGTNTWRLIDEVVPQHILDLEETSVYANGSIYWITYDLFYSRDKSERKVVIVAFDVGSEKFKTIDVPKFITDQFCKDFKPVTQLLEVNDCVALSHILPHGNIAKIWILDDKKVTRSNTTNWSEETLKLPFLWDKQQWVEFHGIVGTDQILIEAYNDRYDMRHVSLYIYNWKSKAFTEVDTGKLYSSIGDSISVAFSDKKKASLCETFTESLLHVQQK